MGLRLIKQARPNPVTMFSGLIGLAALAAACSDEQPVYVGTDITVVYVERDLGHPWNDSMIGGALIAAGKDRIGVVPVRQSMMVVTYDDAGNVDTIGDNSGAGPGEFQDASSIWFIGDTLNVYDRSLARHLRFGADGRVLSASQFETVPRDVIAFDGVMMLETPTDMSYGTLKQPGRDGLLPLPPRQMQRVRGSADAYDGGGLGRLFIFDGTAATVSTIDTSGAELAPPTKLPGWLFDPLMEEARRVNKLSSRPASVVVVPTKFVAGDGQGRALIFHYHPDHELGFAVRFDPENRSFVLLKVRGDSSEASFLAGAFDAAVIGNHLHVVRPDGLRTYRFVESSED